ncbi:VWA domain-containing protein [Actinacidiphila sp. ITFR-21]|uniref:VWA domain-containing protein n=1 Tax=Actinacidiphila sp. ITFR-21 TaxID=3075199 RepID=UPI002889DA37|nr:VWA domain-containing protein [Streptomyces sp. ITFR-21]WNI19607.1 VWA domain-containing protein [Streptomyces sp. ITFR-21]
MSISLDKVERTAPGLISLYKQAAVSLDKHRLSGERATVYLVLDRSGSMRKFYRDGTVQHLAEQTLGLAAHFDDDGTVPLVFFSAGVDGVAEVSLTDYSGRVGELNEAYGHMGRTNYAAAMEAVIDHYRRFGSSAPAFVVFQTDGGPSSKRAAVDVLCRASRLPVFWQLIGFGEDDFRFLRWLDERPVPAERVVDNAGFFAAGSNPRAIPDSPLYDLLTAEFPEWLAAARAQKIVAC